MCLTSPQVLMCDNLALPFRDDTFDAVLSVAVVHHFATTERRVGALRELARVLRIGGRLIISVWAMEQRHRKVIADASLLAISAGIRVLCLTRVQCDYLWVNS